eukprot:3698900-Prymnesium_polylepis.1
MGMVQRHKSAVAGPGGWRFICKWRFVLFSGERWASRPLLLRVEAENLFEGRPLRSKGGDWRRSPLLSGEEGADKLTKKDSSAGRPFLSGAITAVRQAEHTHP